MKISTKIILTNIGFFCIIGLLSVLAVYQLESLQKITAEQERISSALRSQIEADMMHDGLRADVLFALKAAAENEMSLKDEAVSSTAEHVENFKSQIAEVDKLDISKEVEDALASLREPLDRYSKSAINITNLSFQNPAAAQAAYPAFQKDFEYLEGAMGSFSDVIQAEFEKVQEHITATESLIKVLITIVVAFALVLAGLSWWKMTVGVVKPIINMTGVMTALSQGNIRIEIPDAGKKDEIGAMAKALLVFKNNALETENMRARQKEMERMAEEQRKAEMTRIADDFEGQVMGVIKAVSAAAEQMQASAQHLSAIATQTSSQVSAVSAATEEASVNVQSVAAAIEEFTASIQEINRQIAGTTSESRAASEEAQKTNRLVDTLQKTSEGVGEVVALIQAISEQTNLLALNATIEAARAGEAGKGFSVVANEVKNLAGQTKKSTDEIREKISHMLELSGNSASAVKSISDVIGRISENASAVAAAAEQQGATTREISNSVQQAALGTQEVARNITGVSQSSAETGQMASEVLSASSELMRQSEILRGEVEKFIKGIRAA